MRRRRSRRHRSSRVRDTREAATRANESWSMDFMSDQLVSGHRFRLFTLVDNFSWESPAIRLGQRLTVDRVVEFLEAVTAHGDRPRSVRLDNGPEFFSKSLDWWAYSSGGQLDFSRSGKPTGNALIESFNGGLRQGSLNPHGFLSLDDAQQRVDLRRKEYKESRSLSSPRNRSPKEFTQLFGQAHLARTSKNERST